MNYLDPVLDSDNFVWTETVGVCDLTDLPPMNDLPEAFNVRSSRTGAVVHFVISNVMYDREGDVEGWQYAGTGPKGPLVIQIIND